MWKLELIELDEQHELELERLEEQGYGQEQEQELLEQQVEQVQFVPSQFDNLSPNFLNHQFGLEV